MTNTSAPTLTKSEAIFALVLNLVVSLVLTDLLSLVKARRGTDETVDEDYEELGEDEDLARQPPERVPAFAAD